MITRRTNSAARKRIHIDSFHQSGSGVLGEDHRVGLQVLPQAGELILGPTSPKSMLSQSKSPYAQFTPPWKELVNSTAFNENGDLSSLQSEAPWRDEQSENQLIRQKTNPCDKPPTSARGNQVVLQRWYGSASSPGSYLPE